MMDDSFLAVLFGSYQCAFADSCHGSNLAVSLPLLQKRQRQGNLFWRELLRSAISEARILSGNGFSCLGSLHNSASLVLSKGKHDSQNQITCQCVFYKSHVQNMNSDTSFKQLSNNLNAFNGSSGEAVKFTHHKRVPFLKDFQEAQELRSVHGLSCERLFYDLLAAILFEGGNLILQTVSISALSGS